jgi:hypothetical protein
LGDAVPETEPAQAGMFGERDGTANARSTAQADRAAESRLERITAEEQLTTDPARQQQLAAEKAQLLRQVNRDAKIGADEMATRARAEAPQPQPLQPTPKAEALGAGLDDTIKAADEARTVKKEAKRQLKESARYASGGRRTNWLETTDDNGLVAELHHLLTRVRAASEQIKPGMWTRFDETQQIMRSGQIGFDRTPSDLRDMQAITEKLKRNGYSDDEIADALADLDEQATAAAAERAAASEATQDEALDAVIDAQDEAAERAAMASESTLKDRPAPDGFDLFANPFMNPALLRRAVKDRAVRGVVLSGIGAMTAQSDDPDLAATGRGMVGLGLLHAVGMKNLKALGGKGGGVVVNALKDSHAGRSVLNFLSRDILMEPDVKLAVREYERGRAYAKARATELGRRLRQLSPSDDRRVSDVIEREAFEPLAPQDAAAVIAMAKEVSSEFLHLGVAKVRASLIDPAAVAKRAVPHTATLGGHTEQLAGTYLPRMYAEHLATDPTPPGVKPLGRTTGPRQRAEQRRMDLSNEVRNALGEVREASFRTELGVEKGWTNVAAAKLFDNLRQLPGVLHPDYVAATDALRQAKATGDRATIQNAEALVAAVARDFEQGGADGYVRLNDSASYGVLRGAVVREDVAKYIEGLPQLGKALPTLMHWWRKAHTVFNPGTHVGNFLSNTSLAHMAGLPLHEQVTALPKALGDLRGYGPDTKYLAERGILGANVATAGDARPGPGSNVQQALRDLYRTTRPETAAILREKKMTPTSGLERGARAADAAVTRLYAAEDDLFRVALFKKYTSQGMPRAQAAELVRYRLVDYRSASPALGLIRNTASPFVMYTAKAIPMVVSQIIEHPVRWMTLAAGWAAANEFGQRQAGAIDEQKDLRPNQRRNTGLGYLLPGNVQLPFRDKSGNASVANVARFTPMSSLTGSPAPGSLAMALTDDMPGILQPTGPMIDIGARLTNTDPFTGEKILKPGDDAKDVAAAAAQGLGSLALPSAISFHAPRIAGDLANRDATSAAIDALGLVGMRPSVVRKGAQLQREQRELENALYNIGHDLRADLRKTHDAERKRELVERAAERRRNAIATFRERRTTSK